MVWIGTNGIRREIPGGSHRTEKRFIAIWHGIVSKVIRGAGLWIATAHRASARDSGTSCQINAMEYRIFVTNCIFPLTPFLHPI
jgi:hypothetical protein